jgi:hypothetical protein
MKAPNPANLISLAFLAVRLIVSACRRRKNRKNKDAKPPEKDAR